MENQDKQDSLVELGDRVKGEIELPKLDVKPYIGKPVKIEKVTEHKGEYGYYIVVTSSVVDSLPGKDKDSPIIIRATRMFGLQENDKGEIGWGAETQLGVYLKKMGVLHYKDLVGKEVICQTTTSKKDGKDYLTFN